MTSMTIIPGLFRPTLLSSDTQHAVLLRFSQTVTISEKLISLTTDRSVLLSSLVCKNRWGRGWFLLPSTVLLLLNTVVLYLYDYGFSTVICSSSFEQASANLVSHWEPPTQQSWVISLKKS